MHTGDGYSPTPGIDLRRERGLRLWVGEGDGQTELVFQFHHACCDGAGALQLIGDVLLSYANAIAPDANLLLPPLNAQLLQGRGRFGLTPWKLLRIAPQQMVGLLGARQFLQRKPIPLAAGLQPLGNCRQAAVYPTAISRSLTPDETVALKAAARRLKCTVNDLMIRDLFLALEAFRALHGTSRANDWLRLSIPMNLRREADNQLPAANVVSMVFLDRQPPQLQNPQQLLTTVVEEMGLIKRLRLGLTFVFSLQLLQWLPGGLRRATGKDDCRATCVLSNLMEPLRELPLPRDSGRLVVGDLILEGLDVVPPLRPQTNVSIVAFQYAGQSHFTMAYDPRVLCRDNATEILDRYISALRNSLSTPSRPPKVATE